MPEKLFQNELREVMELCDSLMENYEMISLRKALMKYQGLSRDKADEIIRYVAEQGFSYCLDPIIETTMVGGETVREAPSYDVCFWGPDQLKSRLRCC
ncbi:MAG: hypothetical protein ACHQ1D_01150 [Nitrososphaerales archaeon]